MSSTASGAAFCVGSQLALRRAGQCRKPHALLLRHTRSCQMTDERNTPFTPSVHAYCALVRRCASSKKRGLLALTRATRRSLNKCVRDWLRG